MTRPVRCSVTVPVAGEPGAPGDLASVRLCSPAALTPIDIAGSGFVAAALQRWAVLGTAAEVAHAPDFKDVVASAVGVAEVFDAGTGAACRAGRGCRCRRRASCVARWRCGVS
jgi:hypothetical protein